MLNIRREIWRRLLHLNNLIFVFFLEVSLDGYEAEEKSRLIQQVFQLQNTLDGMELNVAVTYENFFSNQIYGIVRDCHSCFCQVRASVSLTK